MSTGYKIDETDFEDIYQKTGTYRRVAFYNSAVIDNIYKNPGLPSYTQLSQFAKKLSYQLATTTGYKNGGQELFSDVALQNWSPTWGDSSIDLYDTANNKLGLYDAWEVSSFNAEVMRITTPGEYIITNTEIPDKKAVNYILWGGGGGGGKGAVREAVDYVIKFNKEEK